MASLDETSLEGRIKSIQRLFDGMKSEYENEQKDEATIQSLDRRLASVEALINTVSKSPELQGTRVNTTAALQLGKILADVQEMREQMSGGVKYTHEDSPYANLPDAAGAPGAEPAQPDAGPSVSGVEKIHQTLPTQADIDAAQTQESPYADLSDVAKAPAAAPPPPDKLSFKERFAHQLNKRFHKQAYAAYKEVKRFLGENNYDNVSLSKLDKDGDAVMRIPRENGPPRRIQIHFGKEGFTAIEMVGDSFKENKFANNGNTDKIVGALNLDGNATHKGPSRP